MNETLVTDPDGKAPVEATEPPQGSRRQATALPYSSPYISGFLLGLTLLAAFLFLGTGLGASGGLARVAAWLEHLLLKQHTANSAYFGPWFAPGTPHVLAYYLVFMGLGVVGGGWWSARRNRRCQRTLERGPGCSRTRRIWLALAGGVIVGFASRLARGCTSGQALTGTALLFTGSVVFLVCLFAGAYATAYFVRREWQ